MTLVRARWFRLFLVIACYGLLIYGGQIASDWMLDRLELDLRPSQQAFVHRMVIATVVLYILLLALPFMPGVEIGLGLMIMLGPEICFLVYLSTVVALTISFCAGLLVPGAAIVRLFDWLGLKRARILVAQISSLPAEERYAMLLSHAPARSVAFLLRHRYLALAVLLNVPGNAFIGGGGGIALVAGMSRFFGFPAFVVTIALAVAPVPLVYYLADGFR